MQELSEAAVAVPALPVCHARLPAIEGEGLNDRKKRSSTAALSSLEYTGTPGDHTQMSSESGNQAWSLYLRQANLLTGDVFVCTIKRSQKQWWPSAVDARTHSVCEAGGRGSLGSMCLNSCILAVMSFGLLTAAFPCNCIYRLRWLHGLLHGAQQCLSHSHPSVKVLTGVQTR